MERRLPRPGLNADQIDLLRVLAVLAGVVGCAALVSSGTFLQAENISNVLEQNAVLFALAIAQFIVILVGGVDLSVGSVVALSSVLFVTYLDHGVFPAALIACAGGALVGLANGLLVALVRLPSFVVSLGSMQIVYSLSKVFTDGGTVQSGASGAAIPESVLNFYAGRLAGVPLPVLAVAAILLATALYLRTSHGHFLYAVGGNERAARLAGIPVLGIRVMAYVLASVIAALGGLMFVARVGYGDPQAGTWLPLDSIAAVSIGGASLTGGRGTLAATVAGVLIISVLNNAMNLIGAPPTLQPTIKGLMIVLTVWIYMRRA